MHGRSSRSIGLITTLSMLMLLLTGCRDYQAEEQIRANAQIQISANQAQAQRDISFNEANAAVGVAQNQKEATIAVSNNQTEAAKFSSAQATVQARIWADKLPLVAVILTFALLAGIVLWYRGKAHLIRVTNEVLLLSPPLPAPSLLSPSRPQPQLSLPTWIPEPVRVMAVERGADNAKQSADGEWLLYRHGHLLLTMRPKQLTDKQRSDAWS